MNDPIREALAATMSDKIATALAATDTAARALWEAMGAPGTFRFGSIDSDASGVSAYFDTTRPRWGTVDAGSVSGVRLRIFSGVSGEPLLLNTTVGSITRGRVASRPSGNT